jgi:hypothetical protein
MWRVWRSSCRDKGVSPCDEATARQHKIVGQVWRTVLQIVDPTLRETDTSGVDAAFEEKYQGEPLECRSPSRPSQAHRRVAGMKCTQLPNV